MLQHSWDAKRAALWVSHKHPKPQCLHFNILGPAVTLQTHASSSANLHIKALPLTAVIVLFRPDAAFLSCSLLGQGQRVFNCINIVIGIVGAASLLLNHLFHTLSGSLVRFTAIPAVHTLPCYLIACSNLCLKMCKLLPCIKTQICFGYADQTMAAVCLDASFMDNKHKNMIPGLIACLEAILLKPGQSHGFSSTPPNTDIHVFPYFNVCFLSRDCSS